MNMKYDGKEHINKKVNKSDTFLSFDNNDMSKTILYSILDS